MRGPESLVAAEPFHGLLHRGRGQAARHCAACLGLGDQPRVRKHIEMLHDRGQRHVERFRKFADGDALASLQFCQQRAPGRVGDSGKHAVQAVGRIVNHVVKYRRVRHDVKGRRPVELRLIARRRL